MTFDGEIQSRPVAAFHMMFVRAFCLRRRPTIAASLRVSERNAASERNTAIRYTPLPRAPSEFCSLNIGTMDSFAPIVIDKNVAKDNDESTKDSDYGSGSDYYCSIV